MLQGTLDTLPLPELLGLLSHSRKTGALWLDAGNSSAVLYLVDGRCSAAETSDASEPVPDHDALLARVIDVCFAVERTDEGKFRFGPEEAAWSLDDAVDLDVAVDELSRLVTEWHDIQAVIPSLDCRVRLVDDLGVDELMLDRDRWQLVVAIDGRRSVRELVRKTNRPVLDVCHTILSLVDAGAINVGPAPAAPGTARGNGTTTTSGTNGTTATTRPRAADSEVEPEAPYGPGVESPHPGPNRPAEEVERVVDPAEKGRYLSAFSGLRD